MIEAIELVPLKARSAEQIVVLAQAYTAKGMQSLDRTYYAKACNALQQIKGPICESTHFHRVYGDALYQKGDIFRAADHYLAAIKGSSRASSNFMHSSDHQHVLRALDCYATLIGATFPTQTFQDKVLGSWMSIVKQDCTFHELMKEQYEASPYAYSFCSGKAYDLLDKAMSFNKSFFLSYEPRHNKIKIELLTNGSKAELFKLYYFIMQSPDEVINDNSWELVLDRGPAPQAATMLGSYKVSCDEIMVTYVPSVDHPEKVSLKLYPSKLAFYLNDNYHRDALYRMANLLLEHALGQIAYLALIDSIELVKDESDLTHR